MAYGLKAINNSNFIQIDNNTVSFQILATGTSSSGYNSYITIPNSYPEDIFVVVRPNSPDTSKVNFVRGFDFDFTDTNGTRTRRAYMNSGVNALGMIYPCNYAIVNRADGSNFTPPTSGYGLNVYKLNGDLGFSSELPVYRVKATRNYIISSTNSGDGYWYYPPSGKTILGTYAFLAGFTKYRQKQYSVGGTERGVLRYYRVASWDYPNNAHGLNIQSTYNDGPNGGSLYDYLWSGYRTEMIGEIS